MEMVSMSVNWRSSSFISGQFQMEVQRCDARIVCKKADIHPKFYSEAKVFCKGEHVMTTSGTQAQYVVDVWSGNHPFYRGERGTAVAVADQISKFKKRFGDTDFKVTAIHRDPDSPPEAPPPPPKKAEKKKRK